VLFETRVCLCWASSQISHLQMIKHVFPEGVEWSWVQSSTPRQKVRAAWQPDGRTLKLALGPAASVPDGAPVMRRHSPAMASGAMKASVKKLRAALHAAAASFRAESGTADGEAVPDLELAPLPPLSSHVSSDMDFVKLGSNQPTVEVKAGAPILRTVSSVPGSSRAASLSLRIFPIIVFLCVCGRERERRGGKETELQVCVGVESLLASK
jgi:hypothetical protein